MEEMFTGAGILCILAALLTRQLKAAGRTVPLQISSTRRQALLAAIGGVLIGAGLLTHLVDPSGDLSAPLHGNISPPHATDAPPSQSDSPGSDQPQMSGQGASSEGPGRAHDAVIERPDRPESVPNGDDEERARSRDRKRQP